MRRARVRWLPALAVALSLAGCGGRAEWSGWRLEPRRDAPDLPLAGAPGETLSLARTGGRLSLVTFGFTSCPDVCPATLSDWRGLRAALGRDTSRVRFVFVSVDWKHDTPEVAAAFARRFDRSFHGVAADSAALATLLPVFRAEASYDTLPDGQTLGVSHTDYTYLVDDSAHVDLAWDFAADPKAVRRDLERLLRERPAPR